MNSSVRSGGPSGGHAARGIRWRTVFGFLVTAGLLWWVLRGVDFGAVLRAIEGADYPLLILAVAVATGGFLIRAFRWKVLLEPIRSGTSLRSRWAAVNIGFMANNLFPLRVGEFARAYALSRMEDVSASGAFGSLAVERFLDAFTVLLLLLVAVMAPDFPQNAMVGGRSVGTVVNGVLVILGVVLLGLVVLLVWPRKVVRLVERMATRFLRGGASRRVVDAMEAFLSGLASLRDPRLMVAALLWSVAFWCWNCLAFWIGFRAFGIHVSYFAALFVNGIVAFAVAVPSSPGFFGTFHAGVKLALMGVYGVNQRSTLAFAFGYHLGGFIPVTVIGLYYAWRLGLSFRDIEWSEAQVEEDVEGGRAPPLLESGAPGDPGGGEE